MNFTDALKTGKPIRCLVLREGVWIQWNDRTEQFDLVGGSLGRYIPNRVAMLATDWEEKPEVLPWYQTLYRLAQKKETAILDIHLKKFAVFNMTHTPNPMSNYRDCDWPMTSPRIRVTIEHVSGYGTTKIEGMVLAAELFDKEGKQIETTP